MKKKSSKSNILLVILLIIVVVLVLLIVILAKGGGKGNISDSGNPAQDAGSAVTTESPAAPGETPGPADGAGSGNSQLGDGGTDETDLTSLLAALPGKEALEEMHSLFSGYWTADNNFVGFIFVDGIPVIDYGLFQSSYGARGEIVDSRGVSPTEAELKVFIEAVPETAMNDAMPERTDIILVDISNYDNNRLNIKLDNLAGGEWLTYEYGGSSIEEAFK